MTAVKRANLSECTTSNDHFSIFRSIQSNRFKNRLGEVAEANQLLERAASNIIAKPVTKIRPPRPTYADLHGPRKDLFYSYIGVRKLQNMVEI